MWPRLGEGGPLDGAYEILAQAQVVDREVDLEEPVDDVQGAPLFRNGQSAPVGHCELECLGSELNFGHMAKVGVRHLGRD